MNIGRKIIEHTKKNDDIIQNILLKDPNYEVRADGSVWTRVSTNGLGLMPDREWRRCDHFDGEYQVISYGVPCIIYDTETCSQGNALQVIEMVRKKKKKLRVHRIVYAKFVGQLRADMVVNHIDGNKTNNAPTNLELSTHQYNTEHAIETLNKSPIRNYHLSFEVAEEIRQLRKEGRKQKELALEFGISEGHVSDIINNRIWRPVC